MKKNIICGSMPFKEGMVTIEKILTAQGYEVGLLEECIKNTPKNIVSSTHFKAIIVINNEKKGIKKYIGLNSFAENSIKQCLMES